MHRPEHWGYVQFTRKPIGSVAFAPDSGGAAKNQLHQIYYAQRDYHGKARAVGNGARKLSLNADAKLPTPTRTLKSRRTDTRSRWQVKLPIGKTQRYHIRQDARVWSD